MHKEIDLDWLAFRYISNEMSAAEVESFERLLGEDQAACEAVARAVELSQAVASVPCDVIPMVEHRSRAFTVRRRFVWWRYGAAAAAVLLAVIGYHLAPDDPAPPAGTQSTLAKIWSARFGGVEMTEYELLADDDALVEDPADVTVPAWLLEAVEGAAPDDWEDS